ncbi:xanthine dehydrogenase family protein molybdopterin-binding subunit [Gracilinema caldarium]|uniref:xanthine dehydrogenase family protein molybdopterin-binding subunit n=1 Tax=Gracilinema caldarium TaxID=215591 RepID=UPI0026F16CB3|nr:molybdopterin cofactor-binding domain-containing protein [Gracilinema caldarium]
MNKESIHSVNISIPKIDGTGLVLGRPAYTEDLAPQDALVVRLLRSSHAHARILSIDTSAALQIEGIACILTWKDVKRIAYTRAGQGHPEPSPHDKFILDEYVRYVGDEVAIVAGRDLACVNWALSLIKVEYEVLPAVLDFEQAVDNPAVVHPESDIHEMFPIGFEPKRNIAAAYSMEVGNVAQVLEDCDVVVEGTWYTQAQNHVAMEAHTAFTYLDLHGRLNVVSSTQNPFHTRRLLGQALAMPLRNIRVQKPRIGGGFGTKQTIHVEPYAALVTLATGKPAKITLTRKEVFEATFTRHQMRLKVRLGAAKDGRLRAIDMQVLSNTGAYGEHALTVFMVGGSKTLPLYNKVEAVAYGGQVVYTNQVSAGAFRGYGAVQGNFALESAMDELAHRLGMSPIELRRRNMIGEGQTSEVFRIMGEGSEGVEMTIESCKLEYCIQRGKELIRWDQEPLVRQVAPGRIRAKGMAIAMQGSGIPLIDMGSANLELQDDGFFKLHIGATDLGTGSDTILAQIAAEELGVPVEDIVVYASDTDHTPYDVGAYASSTTYVSGNAVLQAAQRMKQALREAVAETYKLRAESVQFRDGQFYDEQGKVITSLKQFSFDTLYHNGASMKTIATTGSYSGEKSPPPYMAGFVEIELDTETGKIDVIEYVAVVDCGTTINPNLARIQVEGGLLQGIGMALCEDVQYSEGGHLLTNSLLHYKVPGREDVGRLTVEFAESYEPSGPFGAKSVAEIGIDTPPAAIANALRNATGVRVYELPLMPPRVLKALRAAGK